MGIQIAATKIHSSTCT